MYIFEVYSYDSNGREFKLGELFSTLELAEKCRDWYRDHSYMANQRPDLKFSIKTIPIQTTFTPPMTEEQYQDYCHRLDEADDYATNI